MTSLNQNSSSDDMILASLTQHLHCDCHDAINLVTPRTATVQS